MKQSFGDQERILRLFLGLLTFGILASILLFILLYDENAASNCADCWRYNRAPVSGPPSEEKPLEYFIDSLPQFTYYRHNDWFGLNLEKEITDKFIWKLDSIGRISGKMVVDIVYKMGTGVHYLVAKAILLEIKKGKYRPLYIYVDDMESLFPEKSQIAHIGSHDILWTNSRLGGQGGYYDREYWTWNDDCDCPCWLEFDYSFKQIFASIIRGEFEISHMGSFDPDSLFCWAYVERPGDHYHWPTGGTMWVKLKIDGCKLMVVNRGYDSSRIAPH